MSGSMFFVPIISTKVEAGNRGLSRIILDVEDLMVLTPAGERCRFGVEVDILHEGVQGELDKLISILQKSKKFKNWVANVTPDDNLIKSYYDEVTKGTISDKLPTKSVRWVIFTGLGIAADAIATGGVGTAAGIAIGALDTFYVDKLLSGWKPNQFIDEEVNKIITL